MEGAHTFWLVGLSVLVAVQASYVSLRLATASDAAPGPRLRAVVAGAALTLAIGIWGLHFIGLLAAPLPGPVDYLVVPTVISFLVCVLAVGSGWLVMVAMPSNAAAFVVAAFLMGSGIASMHYIGMHALHASLEMAHDGRYVVASTAFGIGASFLALWLAFGAGRKPPLALSALVLGAAVAGMHYVAMAGMTARWRGAAAADGALLSGTALALIVAVIAFGISAFLLLTLVPDRRPPSARGVHAGPVPLPSRAEPMPDPGPASAPDSRAIAGAAPGEAWPLAAIGLLDPASVTPIERIPLDRKGGAGSLPVSAVLAVRAEGHYTHVFDGEAEFFCSMAISELEAGLDKAVFMRVHRSHIVRVSRIRALRRRGDNGVVELDCALAVEIPVSRQNLAMLKARLSQAVAD